MLNIIDEDYYKSIKVLKEDPVHQVHKRGRCVSQPKWHNHELIVTITASKPPHLPNVRAANDESIPSFPSADSPGFWTLYLNSPTTLPGGEYSQTKNQPLAESVSQCVAPHPTCVVFCHTNCVKWPVESEKPPSGYL